MEFDHHCGKYVSTDVPYIHTYLQHTDDRYYEGRKLLSTIMENSRAIIRDVYSFILKPGGPEIDSIIVQNISDDLRRRLDILFAFVRQSVRESVLGFSPDSDIK